MIKAYNFDEFKKPSRKDWEDKLKQDLGSDISQKISQWKCERELSLSAYYDQDDVQKINKIIQPSGVDWKYLELVRESTSSDKALDALMNGADGLILNDSSSTKLDQILDQVAPEHCTLALTASKIESYHNFLRWWKKNHPKNGGGEFLFLHIKEDDSTLSLQDNVSLTDEAFEASEPGHRVINIEGSAIQKSGGSAALELSFMLSQCVYYINHYLDQGNTIDQIIEKMIATTAVGSSYFLELAKIRVMRALFAQLLKQFGCSKGFIPIHAVTSPLTKSALDSNTNFLRCTSEAMSAVLGGVDYLSIDPDHKLPFADRIARNISNLLKEEAYLSKTSDPAAGSYYVETLTYQIAREAWEKFQKLESKGGYIAAIQEDQIKGLVAKDLDFHKGRISSGVRKKVGVNDFGNPDELLDVHHFKRDQRSFSEDFEKVRMQVESFVSKNGDENRPTVYLVDVGHNAKMINTRYTFVTNFFNWAGFKVVKKEDKKLPQGRFIVACCGGDEDYTESNIKDIRQRLAPSFFVAAGKEPQGLSDLIDFWVNMKSNRLKTVADILNKMGITQISSLS